MRRIVIAIATTISGLVLLFSYYTSTNSSRGPAVAATGSARNPTGTTPSGKTPFGTPPAASPSAPAGSSRTYDGIAQDTPYGPVQVRITVSGRKIVSVQVPQVPSESRRDQDINSNAVPILNQETVSAQSAHIDAVSGATFTSQGYVSSLQSAIDAAHLA